MTLFLEGLGRIDRPVKRIAKGHNKTIASVADHFIFARVKCIMSGLKKLMACLVEDVGNSGPRTEYKANTVVVEDSLDDCLHLQRIGRGNRGAGAVPAIHCPRKRCSSRNGRYCRERDKPFVT